MGDGNNKDEIFEKNIDSHNYFNTNNHWKKIEESGNLCEGLHHVGVQKYQGGWWWSNW